MTHNIFTTTTSYLFSHRTGAIFGMVWRRTGLSATAGHSCCSSNWLLKIITQHRRKQFHLLVSMLPFIVSLSVIVRPLCSNGRRYQH